MRSVRQPRQYTAWRQKLSTLASVLVVAASASGCFRPPVSAGELQAADAGATYEEELAQILGARFDAGRVPEPVDCGEDPSPLSELQLTVRTTAAGGRFQPRNAGAIWIEDADGKWVKTLERWGERRAKWLTVFNEASEGDVTDAITSATLEMHRVHELTWDLTDRTGCEVPDGSYAVRLELTDWSHTGENGAIPFEKGGDGFEVQPEDVAVFRDVKLRLE